MGFCITPLIKVSLYPALTGSKTHTSKFSSAKELGGRSTARKSPIGSTNNKSGNEQNSAY
ncbi:hypothetical protein DT250_05005 [Bacillus sp. AR2-1]|nr:hypothetical protein DT250_05005 [Bacillus sp. AR2-1]